MGGFQRPPPHQQPLALPPGVAATNMSRSVSHSAAGSRQASIASAVGPSIGEAGPSLGPSRGPSLEELSPRQFSFRTLLPEGPTDGWTEAGPERSTAERMGSSPLRAPVPEEEAALASAGSRAAGQDGGEYMSPFEAASQVGTSCRAQGAPLRQAPAADRVREAAPASAGSANAGSKALGQSGKEYVSSFQLHAMRFWLFEGPLPTQSCCEGSAGQCWEQDYRAEMQGLCELLLRGGRPGTCSAACVPVKRGQVLMCAKPG